MLNSSLLILNGVHKIYRRILEQIQAEHVTLINTKKLLINVRLTAGELQAEVLVKGLFYSIPFGVFNDPDKLEWVPHPHLTHKNEIIAITEMIYEFKAVEFQLGQSLVERKRILRESWESFFRAVYR